MSMIDYDPAGATPKLLNATYSAVATGTTAEETLITWTLPANTLNAGKMLRITAFANTAATTGVKTFRVYFGGTTICERATALNNGQFRGDMIVVATGSTTEWSSGLVNSSAMSPTIYPATPAVSASGDIAINLAGTSVVAGEITSRLLMVELVN